MPTDTAPLRIVHVARSPVGGVFRHIADLARAQTHAGHTVGALFDATTGGGFEDGRIAALGGELALGVSRVPMRRALGPGDLLSLSAVDRRLRALKPDVIHAHGAKGGVFGRLGAATLRAGGHPVAAFYAPHGGSLHYPRSSLQGRVYFSVERLLERATDALIHVSAYEARTYCEKVGPPRCAAEVIHNGVAPAEFEPVPTDADAADFLFIGALRDLKGTDVFLDALARLAADGRPTSAHVVGSAETEADARRYRDRIEGEGLGAIVRFHEPMPAREAFRLARTIVVPSRAESLPYIVLEAGAAGMPMIATDVGGIPEIFAGDVDRLIPPGDAAALARALRHALDRPRELAEDARVRRVMLRDRFSIARMAETTEGLYRAALARRRPARPAHAAFAPAE